MKTQVKVTLGLLMSFALGAATVGALKAQVKPPASRVVVSVFDSLDKAQAAYTSPAYLEARKIGDQYGKLRIFAVEAIAQ